MCVSFFLEGGGISLSHSRGGCSRCETRQILLVLTPEDGRILIQTKRRLEVDVDAIGNVRQRDHIDIVGDILAGRRNSWRLRQTRKTLARYALNRWIHPVSYWIFRTGVWVGRIDVARGLAECDVCRGSC